MYASVNNLTTTLILNLYHIVYKKAYNNIATNACNVKTDYLVCPPLTDVVCEPDPLSML